MPFTPRPETSFISALRHERGSVATLALSLMLFQILLATIAYANPPGTGSILSQLVSTCLYPNRVNPDDDTGSSAMQPCVHITNISRKKMKVDV